MNIKSKFNDFFKNDEFIFKVSIGLKFFCITLFCVVCVLLFTYLFLSIDLIYFVSNGYPGPIEFQDAFYHFIYSSLIDEISYIFLILLCIFGFGYFLASVMIRPFKVLGKHCEERLINNTSNPYLPDYFSDLKMLTSFSLFFFKHIDEAKSRGKLGKISIPESYTQIHKPVYEKNFFINYLFVIIIFSLLASLGIFLINNIMREKIIQLSAQFLTKAAAGGGKNISYFIEEQFTVANLGLYFFLGIHLILYLILGLHLYSKISVPAFAIFATFRSFLKGNYHNRVHLIGYSYFRDDCRKVNKYLDYIQKNLI